MKTINPFRPHAFPAILLGLAALVVQFAAPSAFAQAGPYYWDNVAGAGFGTAGGTWSATTAGPIPGWNTDSTGTATPGSVTTATTDISENFGSATAGLASGTVAVSGAVGSGPINFASGSGDITLSGGTSITLPAAATITVNNTSDTISTPLAGAASGLTKSGTGTLILSGANTYTGTTVINAGTLQVGAGGTTGSLGTGKITNNGTLAYNFGSTTKVSLPTTSTLSGTGNLTGTAGFFQINGNIILGGSMSFTQTGTSSYLNGLDVNTPSSLLATNITLSGDCGGPSSASAFVLNTSAANGAINLNISLGRGGVFYGFSSYFTANAGTGAINITGTGPTSAGWSGTPVNLTGAVNITANVANSSSLTINPNGTTNGIVSGALSGAMTLIESGSGTLTLSGPNTYTGQTKVNAGELDFSTAGSATSPITVAASATVGALVASAGGQWVDTGSLTNQTGSLFHVNFTNTTPSTTVAPMKVANLVLGTSLTMKIDGWSAGFVPGQSYPLVTWTGSGPANALGFATLILPSGVSGKLGVSGNTLSLIVADVLTWNTGSGTWDTSTANWLNTALSSVNYVDGTVGVAFADASGVGAGVNPTVTLNSTFSPLGVLMKSTSHDYTITGSGAIGGSTTLTLDPANTHTLTLSTVNSYTGATVIDGGTLTLGGAGQLGSGSYAASVIDNGTFNYNSSASQTLSGTISGSGALNYQGPGILTLSGANTFTGITTITNGTLQVGAGGTTGSLGTGNITNNGTLAYHFGSTTTVSLPASTLFGTGNLTASSGFLQINGNITLGGSLSFTQTGTSSFYNGIFIAQNLMLTGSAITLSGDVGDKNDASLSDTLALNTSASNGTMNLNFSSGRAGVWYPLGSFSANAGTGTINITGTGPASAGWWSTPATLTGSVNITANLLANGALTINPNGTTTGSISAGQSGSMSLTLNGAGTVTLSGTNTYTGNTTISAGTLALSGNGSIATTPVLNLATNTVFDVSAVTGPGYTNPSGSTLAFNIDKTGATRSQGQMALGTINLNYGGSLKVNKSGSGTLASGDSFPLITKTTGTLSGWFSSVTLPALGSGLAWDTNDLATTGVLDIYTFTTAPLALSTPTNTAATISAPKLANHVSSGKLLTAYPAAGWSATVTAPVNGGTVVVNGDGSLTYTPAGAANVNGGTDSFTVTFNDGHGSQTMAVSVAIGTASSGGQSPNVLVSGTDGGGNFYALFAGLPNTAYTVQTNSVISGGAWVKYANYTTGNDGLINVTNVPPVAGTLFFRTVYPSY